MYISQIVMICESPPKRYFIMIPD